MESLRTQMTRDRNGGRRGGAALCVALSLAVSPGCVTLGPVSPAREAPTAAACQVAATWSNQVVSTPDPAHRGEPVLGLAGRVYLFGPSLDAPVVGDGSLVVDLYDDTHPPRSNPPLPMEEWRLDRDTLKRLLRRDAIGWGYTVFLPWGTYRPDVSRVHLKVCYTPAQGTPLYASSAPLTLNREGALGLAFAPVAPTGRGAAAAGTAALPAGRGASAAAPAGPPPATAVTH